MASPAVVSHRTSLVNEQQPQEEAFESIRDAFLDYHSRGELLSATIRLLEARRGGLGFVPPAVWDRLSHAAQMELERALKAAESAL